MNFLDLSTIKVVKSTPPVAVQEDCESSKDHAKMLNAEEREIEGHYVPYKIVVTWFQPFDPSRTGYEAFRNTCDSAFKLIRKEDYGALLQYVKIQVERHGFDLSGTLCSSWESLRPAIEEYLHIRVTEKSLRKELHALKRNPGEELFAFYNRLVNHLHRYIKCVHDNSADSVVANLKVEIANDFILDLFMASVDDRFGAALWSAEPKTIQEAYKFIRDMEITLGTRQSSDQKLDKVLVMMKDLIAEKEISETVFSDAEVLRHDSSGHVGNDCINENSDVTCQYCKKRGHIASSCNQILKMKSDLEALQRNGGRSGQGRRSNGNRKGN